MIERVFTRIDCDTRNDDDDGDGKPVDGSVADGSTTPYVGSTRGRSALSPPCRTTSTDIVDKDGGELPEGVGAIEFQVKFDHKIFDIRDPSDHGPTASTTTTLSIEESNDWTNGRFPNCT